MINFLCEMLDALPKWMRASMLLLVMINATMGIVQLILDAVISASK